MRLAFHQNACDFLGLEPSLDESAVQCLRRRERALGFEFPAAMRELYTLEQREQLLIGAHDVLIRPLAELGEGVSPGFPFCHFLGDYQGQWDAFALLNGDDDPEVRIVGDQNGLLWDENDHPVESLGIFSTVICDRAGEHRRFEQLRGPGDTSPRTRSIFSFASALFRGGARGERSTSPD